MLGLGSGLTNTTTRPFQPNDVDGLALWLKNGVGNTAAQWDDSSGNDNHATQGTSADQATPSKGGLAFDGDDFYNLTSKITNPANNNILVGIVFKITDPFQAANLLSDAANEFFQIQTNKKIKIKMGGTTTLLTNTGATILFDADAGVQSVVISRNDSDTGTWKFYRNNVDMEDIAGHSSISNQANPKQLDFDLLGANADDSVGLLGEIYEVVVYDLAETVLTAEQISDINYYLYNLSRDPRLQ